MLETICDILSIAYNRNWITSRDGNVSVRYKVNDYFYITPSSVRKQTLQPDQFKKINIVGSNWQELPYTDISSNLRPSGELPLHFGLQSNINTESRVVLHLHPTYTVAAMYAELNLQALLYEFPELSRYTKVGPTVPLTPPITTELADICVKNLNVDNHTGEIEFNIIGLDRHGVVAVDTTPWRAFEHIERLEHICKIVLAGRKK
ncbi:class II aldolase/adducin family protein [bacterium]|nr:class II aldolase/adducin family protein [Actinomycetota bacterium]NDG30944.1 class II aldolase/adducin family protein [bacterium]